MYLVFMPFLGCSTLRSMIIPVVFQRVPRDRGWKEATTADQSREVLVKILQVSRMAMELAMVWSPEGELVTAVWNIVGTNR